MTSAQKAKLQKELLSTFVELIRKTSAELPQDVVDAVVAGLEQEAKESRGEYALKIIQKNIELAKKKSQPLCQDTGSILFFGHYLGR
jgi:fumarate hydratase class I